MGRFFWICVAGALGTGTRYLVSVWAAERLGPVFPYGTLIVNLAGCFVISALLAAALAFEWPTTVRLALTVGFIGGLTTYSSFNYETLRLLEEGAILIAGLNIAMTFAGGLFAGWLGLLVTRSVLGR